MSVLLTKGAVLALYRETEIFHPVVQVLGIRKILDIQRIEDEDKYRLSISDGQYSLPAVLAPSCNWVIDYGGMDLKTVIRIEEYFHTPVLGSPALVIKDIAVLKKGTDVKVKIGKPVPILTARLADPSRVAGPSCAAGLSRVAGPSCVAGLSRVACPYSVAGPSCAAGPSRVAGPSSVAEPLEELPGPSSATADSDEERPQGLTCPLCLDSFKNPTLLGCGHTFCKVCLQEYDQHHRAHSYMECPVCRKRTKLGPSRLAELPSNFSVRGLEGEVRANGGGVLSNFCSRHSNIYKDILCKVCNEVICIDCFIERHQGHRIKKKETIEAELKKTRAALIQKSHVKRATIEKSIATAEQHKLDVDCHFESLKREVKSVFEKKAGVLKTKEEALLLQLADVQNSYDEDLERRIAGPKQSLGNINSSLLRLAGAANERPDMDTLKVQDVHCRDLEKSLTMCDEEILTEAVKNMAEKNRFHPADENVLVLGHLELVRRDHVGPLEAQGVDTAPVGSTLAAGASTSAGRASTSAVGNRVVQESRTVTGGSWDAGESSNTGESRSVRGRGDVEDWQASSAVEAPSTAVSNATLGIIRRVDLPCRISGMAALSRDTVVVAYGAERTGTDRISLLGSIEPYHQNEVGEVWGMAFLSDNGSALCVRKGIRVYTNRTLTHTYPCSPCGMSVGLCTDQHDNIFAVNGKPKIEVYNGSTSLIEILNLCQDDKPQQICVTKSGAMIVSSCSTVPRTVTAYDIDVRRGSSIKASCPNEYLYAAVDSNRVWVASVRDGTDLFRLTRYKLNGSELVEKITFKELRLPQKVDLSDGPCYMVSLTHNLLAFAVADGLYFIV